MASAGLEVSQFVSVKREARLAGLGHALFGLSLVPVLAASIKLVDASAAVLAAASALPALAGGLLVLYSMNSAARKTGWTLLVEGVGGWLSLGFIAVLSFAVGGWSMMLQWVGLAGKNAPNILYAVVEAVVGMIFLFLGVTGISASLILVGNLFGHKEVVEAADFTSRLAAALSFMVYPLAAVAAASLAVAAVLLTSEARLPIREAVARRAGI